MAEPNRIHYLDNLRAIAMMLGIFLHSALAYAYPSQNVWLATDSTSSPLIDISIWWIHLFRMSLFFLISGYFACQMISRRGIRDFIRNRLIRLVLPFILLYPFLFASMIAFFLFAISYLSEPQGLMAFIAATAKQESDQRKTTPETMHLWFLYYLIAFSFLTVVFVRLRWFSLAWVFRSRYPLAWFPLLLIPGVLGAGIPMPAPESFIPDWWPFAYYGLFYWAGWQIANQEEFLDQLQPYLWHWILLSVVLFIPYYLFLPVLDISLVLDRTSHLPWSRHLLESVLTAYLSVFLTLASLLFGRRYLTHKNFFLRWISDASYWSYLIHLPIVVFVQTLLIPWNVSVWWKLAITVLVTLAICLSSYRWLVRYTPLGRLLHGKRTFHRRHQSYDPPQDAEASMRSNRLIRRDDE